MGKDSFMFNSELLGGQLFILFIIFVFVLEIVSMWKIFTKAGEEGWKTLIPIYNIYTLCKITGVWKGYIILFLCYPLLLFFAGMIDLLINIFIETIFDKEVKLVISLIKIVYYLLEVEFIIVLSVSLAKSFGKRGEYGIGIMFLSVIFGPILAFGKSEYVGPRPLNIMFGNNKKESDNQPFDVSVDQPVLQQDSNQLINEEEKPVDSDSPQSNIVPGIICKQCGEKNAIDSKNCVKCGNDL